MQQLSETCLTIDNLHKILSGNTALNGVTFTVLQNQNTAIIGETGSGKSTLLKLIAGLETADKGMVKLGNERVKGADEKLLPGHDKIAYLSQYFELRNNYRVAEILSMASRINESETSKIFQLCDIEHLLSRWTDELSGGERQRIAFAKALLQDPAVILLDEPYSHLDPLHRNSIRKIIGDISVQNNITCLMVSHDIDEVLSWADQILVLREGKLIQKATATELYHRPIDKYCASLAGECCWLPHDSALLKSLGIPSFDASLELLIRPSYFTMSLPQKINSNAKIIDIKFKGHYCFCRVLIANEVISIVAPAMSHQEGDNVSVTYTQNDCWWL